MEITNLVIPTVNASRPAGVNVRIGAEVVLAVREAPEEGGAGVVSVAGFVLRVRLPPGLQAGQTLAARVVEATPEQLVLRLRQDGAATAPSTQSHAAGALAVAGDPELLKAAAALVPPGLALPLPNGDALALALPPDEEAEGKGGSAREGESEASFVLHSASLGPIEVKISVGSAGVAAQVTVDRSALPAAQSSASDLSRALELATGTPATVGILRRETDGARPPRPTVAEGLDAYA